MMQAVSRVFFPMLFLCSIPIHAESLWYRPAKPWAVQISETDYIPNCSVSNYIDLASPNTQFGITFVQNDVYFTLYNHPDKSGIKTVTIGDVTWQTAQEENRQRPQSKLENVSPSQFVRSFVSAMIRSTSGSFTTAGGSRISLNVPQDPARRVEVAEASEICYYRAEALKRQPVLPNLPKAALPTALLWPHEMVAGKIVWQDAVRGWSVGVTYMPNQDSFCTLIGTSGDRAVFLRLREDRIIVSALNLGLMISEDTKFKVVVGNTEMPIVIKEVTERAIFGAVDLGSLQPRLNRTQLIRQIMDAKRIVLNLPGVGFGFDMADGHLIGLMAEECVHRADAANGLIK